MKTTLSDFKKKQMGTKINNGIKTVLVSGLSFIPEPGWFITALSDLLWPETGEDIWEQIKNDTELLLQKKIDEGVYKQIIIELGNLHDCIISYSIAVKNSLDNKTATEKFHHTLVSFEMTKQHFMTLGNEVNLLPQLAQFANLHLSLLRDAVLNGEKWGWDKQAITCITNKIKVESNVYQSWTNTWYQKGYNEIVLPEAGDKGAPVENVHLATRQWQARNLYIRTMTLSVLDNSYYWQYFKTSNPIEQSSLRLTREIYSNPNGYPMENPISLNPAPVEKITGINVWGWDRIEGIQLSFDGIWANRMGDRGGGLNIPPYGWNGLITEKDPIVAVKGRTHEIVTGITFYFKSGAFTNECGGNYPGGDEFEWAFAGHILSSIKIMGISNYYGSADCVVFGFRYEDSY